MAPWSQSQSPKIDCHTRLEPCVGRGATARAREGVTITNRCQYYYYLSWGGRGFVGGGRQLPRQVGGNLGSAWTPRGGRK
eukprot:scaffold87969_cov31-Tisochrysis_lutea.AAC.9